LTVHHHKQPLQALALRHRERYVAHAWDDIRRNHGGSHALSTTEVILNVDTARMNNHNSKHAVTQHTP
jgi:hypothetical protein